MKRLWLRLPRWLRIAILATASLVALLIALGTAGWWYLHPAIQRTDGVVYGARHGRPLALDVVRPSRPNGLGVVFMVSGGWKSAQAGSAPAWMMAPLVRRGYTIFAVAKIFFVRSRRRERVAARVVDQLGIDALVRARDREPRPCRAANHLAADAPVPARTSICSDDGHQARFPTLRRTSSPAYRIPLPLYGSGGLRDLI